MGAARGIRHKQAAVARYANPLRHGRGGIGARGVITHPLDWWRVEILLDSIDNGGKAVHETVPFSIVVGESTKKL